MTKMIARNQLRSWNCFIMNSGQQGGPTEYNKKVVMVLKFTTFYNDQQHCTNKSQLSTAKTAQKINQNSLLRRSKKIVWTHLQISTETGNQSEFLNFLNAKNT